MECEPPLLQHILHSLGAPIRRISSAVRTTTATALLAMPVALSSTQEPELLSSPKKELQTPQEEVKKPKKLLTHADITVLRQQMDDGRFIVRKEAQGEIDTNVQYFHRVLGKQPPWAAELTPAEGSVSPEVARRLGHIREGARFAERESFLVPTTCELPKGQTTLGTILERCSKQLGRPVYYFAAPEAHLEQTMTCDSGSLWEVVRSLQLHDRRIFRVEDSRGTGVTLMTEEPGKVLTASNGILYGHIDTKTWNLRVFLEPKAQIEGQVVIHSQLRKLDGSIQKTPLPGGVSSNHVPLTFRDPATMDALEVDVLFTATHRHACHIENTDQQTVFFAGQHRFRFEGMSRVPDDTGHYAARLVCPRDAVRLAPGISALGENAQGNAVLTSPPYISGQEITLRFWKERPTHFRVFIPDDMPVGEQEKQNRTLVFRHPKQ